MFLEKLRAEFEKEDGFSTIEVILILLILVMLVLVFKNQIMGLADTIFAQITKSAKEIY